MKVDKSNTRLAILHFEEKQEGKERPLVDSKLASSSFKDSLLYKLASAKYASEVQPILFARRQSPCVELR